MSHPYQSKQFKLLFAEWNDRLKQSGHKEIEDFEKGSLINSSSHLNQNQNIGRKDYYEMAEEVLETYWFDRPEYFTLWQLHANGASVREIAHHLSKKAFKKSSVATLIKKIQRGSGLKNG